MPALRYMLMDGSTSSSAHMARRVAAETTFTDPAGPHLHTLSLRLDERLYRGLRRFVIRHEDETGRRLTHQAVLETALAEYLERRKAP
jgi:hypothetical protein